MKKNVVDFHRTGNCLSSRESKNLPPRRMRNSAVRSREYLTEDEVARLMQAAKKVGIPVSSRAPATGPVDHIAFNATGFDAMRANIEQRGLAFSQNSLPEIGMRQIFTRDPNGVPIEINFRN